MAKAELGGTEIDVDEDGFIQEPDKWNKNVAEDLAKTENASPMSEEHWKLVNYLRDYYLKFGIAPPIRMVVKQTGFDLKKIYQLFRAVRRREPVRWRVYPNQRAVFNRFDPVIPFQKGGCGKLKFIFR